MDKVLEALIVGLLFYGLVLTIAASHDNYKKVWSKKEDSNKKL